MSEVIRLSRGLVTRVDEEDFERLNRYFWIARPHRQTIYAQRNGIVNGKRTTFQLHREILGLNLERGVTVDHINGDGLDNRRQNLRICTPTENCRNRRIQINNSTGYKGVHYRQKPNKFWAYIAVNGKRVHLGVFLTATEAAAAYNAAAIQHYGEFARLNQL